MESPADKSIVPVPDERIEARIYLIRGKKVMFDRDLAELYGVETKALNQAVKRNLERFPEDFMFRLSLNEAKIPRSQFVTLENGQNVKYAPFVFTEQGVAMLSSVLKSPRAILVNIQIIRTFTKLRELIISNAELRRRLDALESKYDGQFLAVFKAIQRLLEDGNEPPKEIGFNTNIK